MTYFDKDTVQKLIADVGRHATIGQGLRRPIVWSLGSLLADPSGPRSVYAWNDSEGDLHALALEGARVIHMHCTRDGVPGAQAFALSRIAAVSVSSFDEGFAGGNGLECYATQWTLELDNGSEIKVGCRDENGADHLAEFMKSLLP